MLLSYRNKVIYYIFHNRLKTSKLSMFRGTFQVPDLRWRVQNRLWNMWLTRGNNFNNQTNAKSAWKQLSKLQKSDRFLEKYPSRAIWPKCILTMMSLVKSQLSQLTSILKLCKCWKLKVGEFSRLLVVWVPIEQPHFDFHYLTQIIINGTLKWIL